MGRTHLNHNPQSGSGPASFRSCRRSRNTAPDESNTPPTWPDAHFQACVGDLQLLRVQVTELLDTLTAGDAVHTTFIRLQEMLNNTQQRVEQAQASTSPADEPFSLRTTYQDSTYWPSPSSADDFANALTAPDVEPSVRNSLVGIFEGIHNLFIAREERRHDRALHMLESALDKAYTEREAAWQEWSAQYDRGTAAFGNTQVAKLLVDAGGEQGQHYKTLIDAEKDSLETYEALDARCGKLEEAVACLGD